jgi:hypothetical protein
MLIPGRVIITFRRVPHADSVPTRVRTDRRAWDPNATSLRALHKTDTS